MARKNNGDPVLACEVVRLLLALARDQRVGTAFGGRTEPVDAAAGDDRYVLDPVRTERERLNVAPASVQRLLQRVGQCGRSDRLGATPSLADILPANRAERLAISQLQQVGDSAALPSSWCPSSGRWDT